MTAANVRLVTNEADGLPDSDFDYVVGLVNEHAAIALGPDKRYLVSQRLAAVARAENIESISLLVAKARRDRTGRIAHLVVDAMTTNETSFFRDPTMYEFLRAEIIPELIQRNRSSRVLRVWCAAASSGQEPYSVAMLLREHFPQIADTWRVRILATDISRSMIERTRAGRYGRLEVNRGLPANLLVRHFERAGMEWQINKELRSMVEARELNLARPLSLAERFDLVLLRNVLIYFSLDTKRAVLGRVRQALSPGGYVFLGSSESTMHVDDSWVRRTFGNISCYQPEEQPPPEWRSGVTTSSPSRETP